jgi:inosine-uridine nucleoside N-ribohydrolase
MKHALQLALSASLLAQPVPLIFDTDMGNDIDDALALALIHNLERRGEAKLLAVTLSKDNPWAPRYVDLVNTFYRRPDIPLGFVQDGATTDDGKFNRQTVELSDNGRPRYPRASQPAQPATALLRKSLAAAADNSVVIVMVGFSTNIARLLDSTPDAHSPLPGRDLVAKKVKLLSAMAGSFSPETRARHHREYNVIKDIPAAKKVFSQWPTPIVASGWEIGAAIPYPSLSIREDYKWVPHHPVVDAYSFYLGLDKDRPTWDLTSVLYAVRPRHNYFTLSPAGRIHVLDDGQTEFYEDGQAKSRFLIVDREQAARVREAFTHLCSEPLTATAAGTQTAPAR